MIYKIVSSSKAEKDIEGILKWYLDINKILAIRFYADLNKTKQLIESNTTTFQIRYQEIRIAFLNKFPYGIHFTKNNDTITIIAIFHTSRNSINND